MDSLSYDPTQLDLHLKLLLWWVPRVGTEWYLGQGICLWRELRIRNRHGHVRVHMICQNRPPLHQLKECFLEQPVGIFTVKKEESTPIKNWISLTMCYIITCISKSNLYIIILPLQITGTYIYSRQIVYYRKDDLKSQPYILLSYFNYFL